MPNNESKGLHPAAAPAHPKLSRIRCEVWTNGLPGKLLRSFTVDQNTREGRTETAIAARQAMIDGNVFVTYRD